MMLPMMFAAGGGLVNPIPNETVLGVTAARFSVTSTGAIESAVNGGAFSQIGDWYLPNTADGSLYHGKLTKVSGNDLTVGTQNVWLPLTSGQTFGYTGVSAGQIRTGTFTLAISNDGGATTAASSAAGGISITADNI